MSTTPRWVDIARSYIGTKEVPGKGSNAKILAMAKRIGGWVASFFTDDDTAWCGLFVGNCLLEAGLPSTGQKTLSAASYATYGAGLTVPALGAIMVFTRAGGGHVGFYVGEREDAFRVLGGNQSNMVNETWIAKARLTAVRWPPTVPLPTTGRIFLNASNGEPLSTNEA